MEIRSPERLRAGFVCKGEDIDLDKLGGRFLLRLSSDKFGKAASCFATPESAANELTTSRNSTAPRSDGRVRRTERDFDRDRERNACCCLFLPKEGEGRANSCSFSSSESSSS